MPVSPEQLSSLAQVFALVSAGAFFIVKLVHGYLIVDLSVKASVERISRGDGQDYLKLCVELAKGSRATLVLHDVSASLSHDQQDDEVTIVFHGVGRLSYTTENQKRKRVNWSKTSQQNPLLQLAPDETARFESFAIVPSNAECLIDVRVLGRRKYGRRFGQWVSTVVSVPAS